MSQDVTHKGNLQLGKVRLEDFGLESVVRSHAKFVKNMPDVVVVWLHYIMLRNLFKTHGGEGAITEDKTEQLPRNLGWNGERRSYLIKYEYKYVDLALGVYLRDNEADCSLVTLMRSVRFGVPVNVLVRNDLTIRDETCDAFTEMIEEQFLQPIMRSAVLKMSSADEGELASFFDEDD